MIIGTGIDIVLIARIEKIAQNSRFFTRVFTPGEIALFESSGKKIETIAGRFAAKEAILKSMGCGLCDLPLTGIELLRADTGQPTVSLAGAAHERAQTLGISRIHISISHDGGFAIAQAIAEGDQT